MSNELAIRKEKGDVNLTEHEAISIALQSPLVSAVKEEKVFDVLHAGITMAFKKNNTVLPPTDDITYLITGILVFLRRNKIKIHIDEIEIAFYNGIHHKYGKYFGLSEISFCFFITEYLKDSDREKPILLLAPSPEKPKEPSIDDQFLTAKHLAMWCYVRFLKDPKKEIFELPPVYDFLFKIRVIHITQKEIDDLLTNAGTIVHNRLISSKSGADKIQRVNINAKISECLEKKYSYGPIVTEAKKQYMLSLFQGYSMDKIDNVGFGDMIDNNKKYFINAES